MAYTAWSVVFGEQPSAAKWNQLGENDAGFKDGTNIDSGAITTAKIADSGVTTAKIADDNVTADKLDWASTGAGGGIWWEELGRTTLGSAGDTISVTSLAARQYLKILVSLVDTGGNINATLQFNSDTGSNYAYSRAEDGTNTTATSGSFIDVGTGQNAHPIFSTIEVVNIATSQKLLVGAGLGENGSGVTAAPEKLEFAGKWNNTASQVTSVQIKNTAAGSYATGSEVIVLGHD